MHMLLNPVIPLIPLMPGYPKKGNIGNFGIVGPQKYKDCTKTVNIYIYIKFQSGAIYVNCCSVDAPPCSRPCVSTIWRTVAHSQSVQYIEWKTAIVQVTQTKSVKEKNKCVGIGAVLNCRKFILPSFSPIKHYIYRKFEETNGNRSPHPWIIIVVSRVSSFLSPWFFTTCIYIYIYVCIYEHIQQESCIWTRSIGLDLTSYPFLVGFEVNICPYLNIYIYIYL